MLSKIKRLLTDNRGTGFSWPIDTGLTFLLSVILLGLVLGTFKQLQIQNYLDRFADELVSVAALTGKTSGYEIDERYKELQRTTGLSPTVSWNADYYSNSSKTVQYGDEITASLSAESRFYIMGKSYTLMTYTRESTGQSYQYWKGGA